MCFKEGQLVRVKNLHAGTSDGTAIVVNPVPDKHGKIKVKVDHLVVYVEQSRLADEKETVDAERQKWKDSNPMLLTGGFMDYDALDDY